MCFFLMSVLINKWTNLQSLSSPMMKTLLGLGVVNTTDFFKAEGEIVKLPRCSLVQ